MSVDPLFSPFTLPCGVVLKSRLIKSAMSDSLGDGTGHPTQTQERLYERWAEGGIAASIIGEVQGLSGFAEKPGNLVLNAQSDLEKFRVLAERGQQNGSLLWLQLGHAGALSYAPTSAPKGPSALDLEGLTCDAISTDEIKGVIQQFAETARLARQCGFGGVQIHAAHGFLLSQFLSPLFNKRDDEYGGSIDNRMRLLLETVEAVRDTVGPDFPIALKLNSSDQLERGFSQDEALIVVKALNDTSIDILDISGGTYFPGAKSASDSAGKGPYFLEFAKQAKKITSKPLMLTGGFKTKEQADYAVMSGSVDFVGLARALIVAPSLPNEWHKGVNLAPQFPRFSHSPEGGVTAWYTMRITDIGDDKPIDESFDLDIDKAIETYEARDRERTEIWLKHFGPSK
ncbi:MAG: NADH:flavin oxidoreductase/NADH oxidase family protein [Rhizobiaceae bacterium]|nr:NADH:flavin oxidoreductase/NADH oxidase family protein [Rhizobiaceae bacterium]